MKPDETQVISDIAARREKCAVPHGTHRLFKCASPSDKVMLIAVAAVVGLLLIAVYVLSSSSPARRTRVSSDDHLISRLMPRDEVTPEYIASLGTEDPRGKEDEEEKERALPQMKHAPSMMLYTSDGVASRLGSLGVPMGSELSAVLENDVIADDRAVPVIARITKEFRKDGRNIIPRNARLFGSTQGMIEDRVNVRFTKIVFPDGTEHPFSGVALDAGGVGGVPGKLNKKRGKRGANVLSGALIGASSIFAPGGAGFTDTALRGAHRGASGELMRDSQYYRRTEATPVVTIRSNTTLTVLVDRAV